MENDKRAFSRVRASIQAWLRPLHSPDDIPLFNETSSTLQSPSRASLRDSRLSEDVINFLLQMDSKLDAILGMLGRDQILKDFPISGTISEISGAGIRLHTPTPSNSLEQDAHYEVVLALSQMPLRLAGAMGRILRIETRSEWSDKLSYALEFTRIREADLDAVVAFVMQEERKRIREQKWD